MRYDEPTLVWTSLPVGDAQQSVLGACSIHTCLQTSPFPCRMTAIGPPWVPAQLGGRAQPSLGGQAQPSCLPPPSTQLSAEVN